MSALWKYASDIAASIHVVILTRQRYLLRVRLSRCNNRHYLYFLAVYVVIFAVSRLVEKMARQTVRGASNLTAGGDIVLIPEKRSAIEEPTNIMKLQAVQIALLIIMVIMTILNSVKYEALHEELEDIRHLANRAGASKQVGRNGY